MRFVIAFLATSAMLSLTSAASAGETVYAASFGNASPIDAVRRDPRTLRLFSSHFTLNRRATLGYLTSLKRDILRSEGLYTVLTPENGVLKAGLARLHPHDAVFRDATGNPVIVAKGLGIIASGMTSTVSGATSGPLDWGAVSSASAMPVPTATTDAVCPGIQGVGLQTLASMSQQPLALVTHLVLIGDARQNSAPFAGMAIVAMVTTGFFGIATRRYRREHKA